MTESGPSPRAWGFRPDRPGGRAGLRSIPTRVGISGPLAAAGACRRSIPTRVGISSPCAIRPIGAAVHPHARGDFHLATGTCSIQSRSIPTRVGISDGDLCPCRHTRSIPTRVGISQPTCRRAGRYRSIPTRVGISPTSVMLPAAMTVHPHARGDLEAAHREPHVEYGPSPRAWGFLARRSDGLAVRRSIPTRVGISDRRARKWP